MSEFHDNIRSCLEDVGQFLNIALKNEVLSSVCLGQKEVLVTKLDGLGQKYPQLQLSSISCQNNASSPSPQPYIDMNSNYDQNVQHHDQNDDGHYYDVADDTEYEVVGPVCEPSPLLSSGTMLDANTNLDKKECSGFASPLKSGYLEKKGKERLGGFFNGSQKRWCTVSNGFFSYFDRPNDKRLRGQIHLIGYEARKVQDTNKDGSGKACFELVCPGKKTYQFNAVSTKDMKQWIAAIEQLQTSSLSNEVITLSKDDLDGMIEEDIYESLEDHCSFRSGEPDYDEGLSLGQDNSDDLYADAESLMSQVLQASDKYSKNDGTSELGEVYVEGEGHVTDPNSWFICIWDCVANTADELDFKRGDLIKVLSKRYDDYQWWIAELCGQIGLVPKDFLTQAYVKVN